MDRDESDELLPGTTAVAAVRLWIRHDGSVAGRLTTVDDLAAPVENVYVTADVHELAERLNAWLMATGQRLAE